MTFFFFSICRFFGVGQLAHPFNSQIRPVVCPFGKGNRAESQSTTNRLAGCQLMNEIDIPLGPANHAPLDQCKHRVHRNPHCG